MAITTFSRPGAYDGTVTTKASRELNYLALFGGEVLRAMSRATQLGGIVMSKTIPHGKSASFPALSRIGTNYHTPGNSIIADSELGAITTVKRPVLLDDKVLAATFLDSQEEDMTEYDVRAPYAEQLGEALAVLGDENRYIMLGRAARYRGTPGDAATDPDSRLITQLGTLGVGGYSRFVTLTAAGLYSAIEGAAAILDAKSIPRADRFIPLLPVDYWYIMGARDYINREYGGTAILEKGEQTWLAGFQVLLSNNIPQADILDGAVPANCANTYAGEFGRTATGASNNGYVTTAFHKSAIGSIYLKGIEVEQAYDAEYQGDLLIAKMQMGTNVLRPEAAVEINSDATQPDVTNPS